MEIANSMIECRHCGLTFDAPFLPCEEILGLCINCYGQKNTEYVNYVNKQADEYNTFVTELHRKYEQRRAVPETQVGIDSDRSTNTDGIPSLENVSEPNSQESDNREYYHAGNSPWNGTNMVYGD